MSSRQPVLKGADRGLFVDLWGFFSAFSLCILSSLFSDQKPLETLLRREALITVYRIGVTPFKSLETMVAIDCVPLMFGTQ